MNIKPNWDVFKVNFAENPQDNFEWMCYQLFCRTFGCDSGLFRFYNHPALEAEPIHKGKDIIGFQAKFYKNNLSNEKAKIKTAIQQVKSQYPELTILYFYAHQDWTSSKASSDKKTKAQKEIEDFALKEGLKIEFKTKSFFESTFVTIDNSDITQYFFDIDTNDYYKKIRRFHTLDTALLGEKEFETSLYVNDDRECLFGKNILSDFIFNQLKTKNSADFSNIYIRGVAGIGKSTEMRIAYNNLIRKCSHADCYHEFCFLLPTPYFYELKAYQEGCFKIIEKENPILFLDGMDEIPNSKVIPFVNELLNLKSQNPSVNFIIAGRDASFPYDLMNKLKHIDVRLSFHVDDDLQNLINRFKGTVFEPFVGIPFYRTFFSSDNFKSIKTYKDIIERLLTSRLEDDKKGVETDSLYSESEIDTNELIKKLASFSFNLFSSGKRIFSKEILLNCFDKKETIYLLRSCLFDYKNSSNISFFSVIYFEYFVALYFSLNKYAFIEKKLFTSTGKVIVQHINIVTILLNLIPNNEKKHIQLANKLKKESFAYILLTDYVKLPKTARFDFYNEIIN